MKGREGIDDEIYLWILIQAMENKKVNFAHCTCLIDAKINS